MNLLQDMGLKEEHQSVLDHLDVMEQQIVQANKDDADRTEALNRALYGQAIAEQDARQLKQQTRRLDQQAALSPTSASAAAAANAFSSAADLEGLSSNINQASTSRRHPFAPQVVIVGAGEGDGESDEDLGEEETFGGYNDDVLLNFQAQEQAQFDDQQDSFFAMGGLKRNASTARMVTADEEWCRTNSARATGLPGESADDHVVSFKNEKIPTFSIFLLLKSKKLPFHSSLIFSFSCYLLFLLLLIVYRMKKVEEGGAPGPALRWSPPLERPL